MRHRKKKQQSKVATYAETLLKSLYPNVNATPVASKKLDIKQLDFTIDFMKLHLRCKATIDELMNEVGNVTTWANYDANNNPVPSTYESYAFKDNGSNVLAVAHCDTIQSDGGVYPVKLSAETLVFCQKCDDRLGVYTILDLLPTLGVECDILLTMNEERGASTARLFKSDKKYDWIVEFDRNGTDAVTYDYGDKEWHDTLEPYFNVSRGSFSDISEMQGLQCKALNVGIGYHDEHSKRAFFVAEEYMTQISHFVAFYDKYRHTQFPHIKKQVIPSYQMGGWTYHDGYGGWNGSCGYNDDFLHTPIEHDSEADNVTEDTMHYCPECEEYFYEHDTIKVIQGIECPYCGEVVKENGISISIANPTSAMRQTDIDNLRKEIERLKYRSGSNKRDTRIDDIGEQLPF